MHEEHYLLVDPSRGPRVVELHRRGAQLDVRHGGPDALVSSASETFGDPGSCQRALRRRIKRLRLRGYGLAAPDHPSMRDAIRSLDDLDALQVYADWLCEHGHPRGPLIRTQIAAESDPALQSEVDALLARFQAWFVPAMLGQGVWRRGFLDHLQLDYRARRWSEWAEHNLRETLAAVRRHPSGRFVRYAVSQGGIRVE